VFIGKPAIGLGYEPGASVLIQLTNNDLIHVWETMVVRIPFDEKITSYYNPIHGTYIYPYATTESKKVSSISWALIHQSSIPILKR
jgi:hypothetical protein